MMEKLHEECGIFGIFRRTGEGVVPDVYHALYALQHPEDYLLVLKITIREALEKAGRTDLIGFGPECLIRPRRGESAPNPRFRDAGKSAGKPAGKAGGRDRGGRDDRPPKHGGRSAAASRTAGKTGGRGGKSAAPGKGRAPAARGGRPAGNTGKTGTRRKP